MIAVAFNLGRTPFVTRDDDALGVTTKLSRGGEVEWFARNDFFGTIEVKGPWDSFLL